MTRRAVEEPSARRRAAAIDGAGLDCQSGDGFVGRLATLGHPRYNASLRRSAAMSGNPWKRILG
jgi:hypothetical protein